MCWIYMVGLDFFIRSSKLSKLIPDMRYIADLGWIHSSTLTAIARLKCDLVKLKMSCINLASAGPTLGRFSYQRSSCYK